MRQSISRTMLGGLLAMLLAIAARAQTGGAGEQRASARGESPGLHLSLKQAVDLALAPDGSAKIQLVRELVHQLEARTRQARAALLPTIESSVSQQNLTKNLAAFGIRFETPLPGFKIPERVGPFNVFDARATLSQNIFDLASIRHFQASRANEDVAATERDSAQDQVTGQVARAYVTALREKATVTAVRSNVELAEALWKLAADQKRAGTGTAIEETRAQVQLFNERQRLLVAENERRKGHLQLLRTIGLELDVLLELSDKLVYLPMEAVADEQAIAAALQSRADYKAQLQREESARLNYSASKLERAPALVGFADYGSIGSSLNHASPTRTFGLSLRVPVFDGGRRDARRAESASLLEQEKIRTRDLRQQIDLEIRLALDGLRSAEEQVKVAAEGLALSERELEQAQRRYRAGVTTSLEVTDAQSRLERARDNQVAALFNHNFARISVGEAMGTIRQIIK